MYVLRTYRNPGVRLECKERPALREPGRSGAEVVLRRYAIADTLHPTAPPCLPTESTQVLHARGWGLTALPVTE
jgi:hypothetical protein